MRRALVLFAVLLTSALAGCIASEEADPDAGTTQDPGIGETTAGGNASETGSREDIVKTWDGIATGVGFYADPFGANMAGAFTLGEEFAVPPDASTLRIELTRELVTSTDMFLTVSGPDEWHAVGALPDALPLDPIVLEITGPQQGSWGAMGFLEGAGVEQAFTVTVTIAF